MQQGLSSQRQLSIEELALWGLPAEEQAMTEAFHLLRPPFAAYFLQRVRNHAVADELIGLTLAEGLLKLRNGSYNPRKAKFLTLLYRIAHDKLVDWKRRGTSPLPIIASHEAAALNEPEHPGHAIEPEEIEAVRDCVSRENADGGLSDDERIVVLGRAQGETFESLGKRIGRGLAVTHARYQSALAKLRRCMEQKGFS